MIPILLSSFQCVVGSGLDFILSQTIHTGKNKKRNNLTLKSWLSSRLIFFLFYNKNYYLSSFLSCHNLLHLIFLVRQTDRRQRCHVDLISKRQLIRCQFNVPRESIMLISRLGKKRSMSYSIALPNYPLNHPRNQPLKLDYALRFADVHFIGATQSSPPSTLNTQRCVLRKAHDPNSPPEPHVLIVHSSESQLVSQTGAHRKSSLNIQKKAKPHSQRSHASISLSSLSLANLQFALNINPI